MDLYWENYGRMNPDRQIRGKDTLPLFVFGFELALAHYKNAVPVLIAQF